MQAIECEQVPDLHSELLPGCKILLKGPVECRRAIFKIRKNNVQVLGGELQEWMPLYGSPSLQRALLGARHVGEHQEDLSQEPHSSIGESESETEEACTPPRRPNPQGDETTARGEKRGTQDHNHELELQLHQSDAEDELRQGTPFKKPRDRVTITDEQKAKLEIWYALNKYPGEFSAIAKDVGLAKRSTAKHWFQNRRKADRKRLVRLNPSMFYLQGPSLQHFVFFQCFILVCVSFLIQLSKWLFCY